MNQQEKLIQEFSMYTKIQDKLMMIGNNAIMYMNLILYSNSEKYGRRYYYKETQYIDRSTNPVRKIVRDYDAYLSIENIKPINDNYKEFICLRGKDIEYFNLMIRPYILSLLRNDNNEFFEERSENKWLCNNNKGVSFDVGTKIIIFKPEVSVLSETYTVPSLAMYLNDANNKNVLYLNQIYEFLYILRNLNLFEYASSMLAYMGRPMMGTNMYDMTSKQMDMEEVVEIINSKPISIETKKKYKKSYFDK